MTKSVSVHNAQSKDSYMWYDELHPSEQTSRIVAKEFVGVLNRESKYAKYYSAPLNFW